ncbi:unnamed protein product [Peniophora sp. CBMAI 1063]|nr:unnamed protein product [Peniophora sp. CBMAI 1063]
MASSEPGFTATPLINRMPIELLTDIFAWLALIDVIGELEVDANDPDDDVDEDSDGESQGVDCGEEDMQCDESSDTGSEYTYSSQSDLPLRVSWGWARVTHVCSLWRNIALACPSLWTTIPLDLPLHWVDELIKRSGEESVRVVGTDTFLGFDLATHRALKRIRSIEVDFGSPARNDHPPFLTHPFPAATEMTLHGQFHECGWIFDENIFPRLTLPEESTELHLICEPRYVVGRDLFTVTEVIDIIGNLANMEILSLANCFPLLDDEDVPLLTFNLARIEFPRLQALTFVEENNTAKAAILFFNNVRFPASARVNVSCLIITRDPSMDHGPPTTISLDLDSFFWRGDPELAPRTLAIIQSGTTWRGIDVHAWRELKFGVDGSPDFLQTDKLPLYLVDEMFMERSTNAGDIAIQYRYDFGSPHEDMGWRWALFNQPQDVLSNVRALTLSLAEGPLAVIQSLEGGYMSLLRAARRVEHLRLAGHHPDARHSTAAAVLPALCEFNEEAQVGTLERWALMPALCTLTLQNMDPYAEMESGETLPDALREVVRVRADGGSPLRTIYIHNWMFNDDDELWREGLAHVPIPVVYDIRMH